MINIMQKKVRTFFNVVRGLLKHGNMKGRLECRIALRSLVSSTIYLKFLTLEIQEAQNLAAKTYTFHNENEMTNDHTFQ